MARFPLAQWIGPPPASNYAPGLMRTVHGLCLHIEQGSNTSAINWFKNPSSQVSAHFLNPKQGQLVQMVDTADMAYAECDGNPNWISCEHEGMSGDSLTPSQFENDAQLIAWLVGLYGFPVQPSDDPNGEGIVGHTTGGAAWGDHLQCPGDPIMAQRAQLCVRANQILHPQPTMKGNPMEADIILNTPSGNGYYIICDDGAVYTFGDAQYHGSCGQLDPTKPPGGSNAVTPARPIVAAVLTPSGNGYRLLGADGGTFNFGDAKDFGNLYTVCKPTNPYAAAQVPA